MTRQSTSETNEDALQLFVEERTSELLRGSEVPLTSVSMEVLCGRYGLGERPNLRRVLFEKVIETCLEEGIAAEKVVRRTMRDSQSKNAPDRWFCTVVVSRLRANGFDIG